MGNIHGRTDGITSRDIAINQSANIVHLHSQQNFPFRLFHSWSNDNNNTTMESFESDDLIHKSIYTNDESHFSKDMVIYFI